MKTHIEFDDFGAYEEFLEDDEEEQQISLCTLPYKYDIIREN